MDSTHLHLLSNHIPILATIFSVFILGWGLLKSDKSYQEIALIGFIVAGAFSIVALQSGEGAEDIVEKIPGVSEVFIHDHEEAAEIANWAAVAMALASLAAFWIRKKRKPFLRSYLMLLLMGGLISGSILSYTAYLGGQIRHTEIRTGYSEVQQPDADGEDLTRQRSELPR